MKYPVRRVRGSVDVGVDELRQRCAAAEQALEKCRRTVMLGSISSALAHDLNNLLGVISNGNVLLHRLCSDSAALAPLAASGRAVERGTRLTAWLHRLSTVREATGQPIDLRALLPGLEDLAKIIAGKRVRVSLHVAPGTWRVRADADQLELSLIALLMNAREAMPDGGQVWIDARNAEPTEELSTEDRVALTVTDDGAGMSSAQVARAFEPYFTTRTERDACGLGLSQVAAFCETVGGAARLASTVGLGTAVTMLLPAETTGLPQTAAGPGEAEDSTAGATPDHDTRLLLVEDSDDVAEATSAVLRNHGYRVEWARDADEAWRILEREDGIGIVLSDVMMPGSSDGVTLARRVNDRWPALPVVLISGQFSESDKTGNLRVLRKPCAPELLVATLRREMARCKSQSARP